MPIRQPLWNLRVTFWPNLYIKLQDILDQWSRRITLKEMRAAKNDIIDSSKTCIYMGNIILSEGW